MTDELFTVYEELGHDVKPVPMLFFREVGKVDSLDEAVSHIQADLNHPDCETESTGQGYAQASL